MLVLAELTPLDPVTGLRVTLRVCSAEDRAITALNAARWVPALVETPVLTMKLFDGDFSSDVDAGTASLAVLHNRLLKLDANAGRFVWAGAGVKLWAGSSGDAWPWTQWFEGSVAQFEAKAYRIKLTAKVRTEPFDKDALTLRYAGTGGAEGDANLKNKVKPWVFGRAIAVEPVLIDTVNNVFQFSAYGPIHAVTNLFERGSDFGASVGDYASYAALIAAPIPARRWGTCLAAGMVRLGAPAYGVITGDVDGDKPSGTWIRKTGEIISRIAANAGVSGSLIDTASLAALDAAVPYNINLVLGEQTTVLDIARRLARACNAQAGISWLGKLFVCRVAIGTPALALDAQGRRKPGVIRSTEADVSPPYWRIEMGAQRAWRVHSLDEISSSDRLEDRGDYAPSGWYDAGDLVKNQGIRWKYINAVPGTGNAPPALPTTSNAWWEALDQKIGDFFNTNILTGERKKELIEKDAALESANLLALDQATQAGVPAMTALSAWADAGNILSNARALDNAYWSKLDATVTPNVATALFGSVTTDRITPSGTSNFHGVYRLATTVTSGAVYCYWTIVAADGYDAVSLAGHGVDNAGWAASFDLTNGRVVGKGSNVATANIVALRNGRFLCYIVVTANSASGDVRLYVGPSASLIAGSGTVNSGRFNSFASNGGSVLIDHIDAEPGSVPSVIPSLARDAYDTAVAARTAWRSYRDGLAPAWNDTTQNTTIVAATFQQKLQDYVSGLDVLNKLVAVLATLKLGTVQEGADVTALNQHVMEVAADQTVRYNHTGTAPLTGQLPRTLLNVRKKGNTVVTTDNGTSWSITPSNVTATIDNTNGSSTKGQITITAVAGNGYIDVTSTNGGVTLPPRRILVHRPTDDPPSTGGTGALAFTANVNLSVTDTSFDASPQVLAGATGRTNASGAITTYIELFYNAAGTSTDVTVSVKLRRSAVGAGVWTDWATGTLTGSTASNGLSPYDAVEGQLFHDGSFPGGAASTDYDWQLIGFKSGTSASASVTGYFDGSQ